MYKYEDKRQRTVKKFFNRLDNLYQEFHNNLSKSGIFLIASVINTLTIKVSKQNSKIAVSGGRCEIKKIFVVSPHGECITNI